MSSSENESDFASAESDQEDGKIITEQPDDTNQEKTLNTTQPQSFEEPPAPEPTENQSETTQDLAAVTKKETSAPEDQYPVTPGVDDVESKSTAEPPPKEKNDPPPEVNDAPKQSGGGWGWGGWGTSLWSSVSTVTESAQVLGSKVTSVIASVEEGLGLPSPAEMAKFDTEEEKALAEGAVESVEMKTVLEEPHSTPESNIEKQTKASESDDTYGVGFLSGLASVVQSTGKDLMSGGLDALETLGKKTMEALSDGDPGLQKKRAILGGKNAPTLSQLLEEAKNRPAESSSVKGEEIEENPLCYSRLFDEYHGVVHLEALELLSRECIAKINSPSAGEEDMERLRENMEELEALFQVEEEQEALDDDNNKLTEVPELFSTAKFPLKYDKLLKVSTAWREKVKQTTQEATPTLQEETPTTDEGDDQPEEKPKDLKPVCETLYADGLRSLAELTSTAIELFRKISELTLLPDGNKGDPIAHAKKLNRLTVLVSSELDCLASVHSEAIAQLDIPDTNSSVTSLYLEASNSSTYVQDAFQLLLPVLKLVQFQQFSSEVPQPNIIPRT